MAYKSIWLWWEGGVSAQEFLTLYNSYKLLGIWLMQAQEKGNQGDACMEVDVQ